MPPEFFVAYPNMGRFQIIRRSKTCLRVIISQLFTRNSNMAPQVPSSYWDLRLWPSLYREKVWSYLYSCMAQVPLKYLAAITPFSNTPDRAYVHMYSFAVPVVKGICTGSQIHITCRICQCCTNTYFKYLIVAVPFLLLQWGAREWEGLEKGALFQPLDQINPAYWLACGVVFM